MKWKCLECGGMFDQFKCRYNSSRSPLGDYESVCPSCGAVEPLTTRIEEGEDEL